MLAAETSRAMPHALPASSPPTSGLPAALAGALWMCGAACAFALMVNLVRHLTQSLDPLQVVFFRNAFGLLAMLPWLLRHGLGVLRTDRIGLHALRAAIGIVAMVCWFTTLALLPLAQATALSFTAPIFTSILAMLLLGEAMRARRWTATAIGFAGALIILRPGVDSLHPAALLAILTALVWALSSILVKVMARTESAGAVVTYLVLFSTPFSLAAALFVWQTPTLAQLALAAVLGAAGSAGHFCMTRALASADAGAVMPFDYLRLPVVAAIAYIAFGEVPDLWVWLGGAVIAASGLYIVHREARLQPATLPAAAAPETRA
jgi:drug/metabolite transporter (DMT)-like permease